MVTPENGTLLLKGVSGKVYSISTYVSDVLAAPATFNLNGIAVAGSITFYIAPENCVIQDFSIATGNTVATALVVQANDVNTGSIISLANSVNTLSNRPPVGVGFAKGSKITLVQA
jgi:hypothetical protein